MAYSLFMVHERWATLARGKFHRSQDSPAGSMRAIRLGGILGFLLLPGSVAIIPDAVPALILNIAICQLRLTLAEPITPSLSVDGVAKITLHILFILPFHHI